MHSSPLPTPAEGFPFQRHTETKSKDSNHLSVTNCDRVCFAKLAPLGFQEPILGREFGRDTQQQKVKAEVKVKFRNKPLAGQG